MEPITVKKSDNEFITIQQKEFKGNKFIDFRLWYLPNGSKEPVPTRKGFTVPIRVFEKIKERLSEETE